MWDSQTQSARKMLHDLQQVSTTDQFQEFNMKKKIKQAIWKKKTGVCGTFLAELL